MMTPLPMRWDGQSFTPINARVARAADQEFVVGDIYRLEAVEERSAKSHRHFFAAVNEAWANLPESLGDQFPSPDHLRRWCLIRAGYAEHRNIVAASKAEAQRIAAFVKPMDSYAVVTVRESVVTVYTAESQSMKAMGKQRFQESKDAVLSLLAAMIGADPVELGRAAA